jgi:hypothetical protein
MLERDPLKRITMEEILQHPLVTESPFLFNRTASEPNTPMTPMTRNMKETLYQKMHDTNYFEMFNKVVTKQVVELSIKNRKPKDCSDE